MKRLILLMSLITPFCAKADMQELFTKDGTTLTTVQNAIQKDINGKSLTITEYSKAWQSYNPIFDYFNPDHAYRDLGFEFIDRNNKKQSFKCSAALLTNSGAFFIFNCVGNDKNLREFNKLGRYGYQEDSIILNDIIDRSPDRDKQESSYSATK